jgi:uncharacterized protein (TIGR03435 family)
LILTAWDLNINPDQIPGAPKWLAPFDPSFDLFAKAPASAIVHGAQLYQGDYQAMLRALLVDRFGCGYFGTRVQEGYSRRWS